MIADVIQNLANHIQANTNFNVRVYGTRGIAAAGSKGSRVIEILLRSVIPNEDLTSVGADAVGTVLDVSLMIGGLANDSDLLNDLEILIKTALQFNNNGYRTYLTSVDANVDEGANLVYSVNIEITHLIT